MFSFSLETKMENLISFKNSPLGNLFSLWRLLYWEHLGCRFTVCSTFPHTKNPSFHTIQKNRCYLIPQLHIDYFCLLLSQIDKLCLVLTIIIVCRCVHTMAHMWTSECNIQELVLSFEYEFQGLNLGHEVFITGAFNPWSILLSFLFRIFETSHTR